MTLLETRGLSKHFGGLAAVANVDFTLDQGEVRALIGPNGAGKTTFASLIAGRLPPSAGHILFEGQDITRLPAYKRVRLGIAYTFQITSIYMNLSVAENVKLAVQSRHAERKLHTYTEYLALTGLAEREAQIAGTLSYGHQRLLEIAMGLALRPRLLILDEPTQGLADQEIADFLALIKSIASVTTILLIEHNMPAVMAAAHKITVFERGKILAEGPPEAIRADMRVKDAYLGHG